MPSALFRGGWQVYVALGGFLFVATFGFAGLLVAILSTFLFFAGILSVLLQHGWERSEELTKEFDNIDARYSTGIPDFLRKAERIEKSNNDGMTGSPALDPILDEILNNTMRDFFDTWYSSLTNDELMKQSLMRSARRTIAALTVCLRSVNWEPLLTRHIVDDFASHLRLYRKAQEKVASSKPTEKVEQEDLETIFFDLELEMESYCRDLVSTSRQYENAYLHDVADILLYLLIPAEDFRTRPFRFLIREILVKRLLLPILDLFSEPDYINYIIVWLLSEVPVNYEDFVAILQASTNIEELRAMGESLDDEIAMQRAKDTGGEDVAAVKQQLSSLKYVRQIVDRRIARLEGSGDDAPDASLRIPSDMCDVPLKFVLSNSIGLSYFIDFLQSVGGQNYIDCYLAIEGFRVSVEHQLISIQSRGIDERTRKVLEKEMFETIREAAHFMQQQYLSEEAIDRVPLDDSTLNKFLSRLRNDHGAESWFDPVQEKIRDILDRDVRFFPAFKRSDLYYRMLADLDLIKKDNESLNDVEPAICEEGRTASPMSDLGEYEGDITVSTSSVDCSSATPTAAAGQDERRYGLLSGDATGDGGRITAEISTLGIGRQSAQSFALYNIRVGRENNNGEQTSCWNVMRRYSDFHTLHAVVEQKYPDLASLSFPGKKTFNNLNSDFLEKRRVALSNYMVALLHPDNLRMNRGLEQIVMNFLCQKEYTGEKGMLSRKVVSAVFNPIRSGVRAFGTAVTAVPETVFDGVVRVGDEINKAAKQVLGPSRPAAETMESSRVGASIGDQSDSIPVRVMLLFVDEVFGLRARNQWFRRRLVAFLRQFVHAALGSSINKKIVDMVVWLTGEEQVAEYLRAFKNSFWPGGVLAEPAPLRPENIQLRTRVVAKAKMLASLPDELRLFIGNETSRAGIELIFEALQNPNLNRRFIYVLENPSGGSLLVTEYLEMSGKSKFSREFGNKLARLHLQNAEQHKKAAHNESNVTASASDETYVAKFGFHTVTCCGYLPQVNDWCDDWIEFFVRNRLRVQVDMAIEKYGDRELKELWPQLERAIPSLFNKDEKIFPALLHGDLWSGNFSEIDSEPVVFDPASFYGHSEYEFGIAKMFGGFDRAFYDAYHQLIPKSPGFDRRVDLYQLFHHLNHWNHFGSGYRSSSVGLIKTLL
uniref:protein-ribulosamine 3-kinase n=1 Tax=Plectus sambesii TaxID=2011161 RepID=A0A914XQG5_9BILA